MSINLAATDLSENIVQVKKLIGLLQTTVNFFSESSKRSNVWTELSAETRVGSAKLSKLQGWRSKQAALERIFGTYEKPKPEAFSLLIEVVSRIEDMPNFDLKARFEANVSLPKWCSFVINLTAFLLLRVYSILRAASEYLQGLDYLSAWSMVQCAKEALKRIQFDEVHEKTSCFISKIKDKVDTLGVTLENTPGEKRVSRKKLIPGGQARDSVSQDVGYIEYIYFNNCQSTMFTSIAYS